MKTNKLLAAGALALSMAMTPVASLLNAMPIAAETINNETQHTYRAYQIFTGSQDENGTLGNIDWGTGVNGGDILTTLKAPENSPFKDCTKAADVAVIVAGYGADSAEARAFAQVVAQNIKDEDGNYSTINANTVSPDLNPGYYLLVDQTDLSKNPNDVKGLSLLQLTKKGSVDIKLKTGKPTVSKKVEDEKDGDHTGSGQKEYYDSADHEIGEVFNFKLTAQLPDEVSMNEYKQYKVVFHDTLSTGLVRDIKNNDNAIVIVKVNDTELSTSQYTVDNSPNDGTTFALTINNIVPYLGEGKTLQNAKVEVIYRAKLTADAEVSNTQFKQDNKVVLEFSNNPNVGGEGDTGKGPEDTVFVGTYELPNIKKDGTTAGKPALAEAGFKLGNSSKNKWATFDDNGKLTGWVDDIKNATEIRSGTDGKFVFKGLDADTYTLRETTTPAGFNTAADQTITLSTVHAETTDTKPTVTVKLNGQIIPDDGHLIENYKGSTLPETGGMGTTVIYGIGAVMVAGAAVFYVTNKRIRKD